jgi:hypothetical protein
LPTGEIPNPLLDARVRDRDVKEKLDNIEFATTADRILGLLQDEPIDVELTDKVTLSFYPPTDEQYIKIVTLQAEGLQFAGEWKSKGFNSVPKTDEEALEMIPGALTIVNTAKGMLHELNVILAALSVDKSFTAEKFEQMPRKYKNIIVKTVSSTQSEGIKKVKKFRSKQLGNRVVPDASVLGTASSSV